MGRPEKTCMASDLAVALLALQQTPGTGVKTLNRLLASARETGLDLPAALGTSVHPHPFDPRLAELIASCGKDQVTSARELADTCRKQEVAVIARGEEGYPEALTHYLEDEAPTVIFLMGDASLLHPLAGAVVGTRTPTPHGIALARKCAGLLTDANAVVVSGGAQGVDTAAHNETLARFGRTVIVLPEGILHHTTPPAWAEALRNGSALLLSEVHPFQPWRTFAAVGRNRLIAALSRMVCVVEPRKMGGSIATARHGIAQRKPVFLSPATALPAGLRQSVRPILKSGKVDAAGMVEALHSTPQEPPRNLMLF